VGTWVLINEIWYYTLSGKSGNSRTLNSVKPLRPWVGDETDDRADEAILLVRRRYPETNQCSNQAKD
jgi:hypothetical protein